MGFVIEVMNFDGYTDMRMVEFLPAGPNVPYLCWVWDVDRGQYVYHPALSAIPSLEVDFENELIWTLNRSSAAEHVAVYYRYIDDSLVLIKKYALDYWMKPTPDQGYEITHELIEGQWTMTIILIDG